MFSLIYIYTNMLEYFDNTILLNEYGFKIIKNILHFSI